MGYSKKSVKMEGGEGETEGKKWMLTALRSPLKPIHTNRDDNKKECDEMHDEQVEYDEDKCTTPTSEESRIPASRFFQCPGAPKKRKSSSNKFQFGSKNVGREFFSPPELETLFMQSVVNHQKTRIS